MTCLPARQVETPADYRSFIFYVIARNEDPRAQRIEHKLISLLFGRALSGQAFATRFFSYCITKKSSNKGSILHAKSSKNSTLSFFMNFAKKPCELCG
jgi:hypothetical protein